MCSISILRKGIIHFRTWLKILVLLGLAVLIIVGIMLSFYKTTYAVSYNGEFLGYVDSKSQLQSKINNYIKTGNGNTNIAFAQIESIPKYEMCLLKRDVETNNDEIYDKIVNTGTLYYKYYVVKLNGEDKYNVATSDEANTVLSQLKEKNSNNIKKISVSEKYSTELVAFSDVQTCVNGLYEKKVVVVNTGYSGTMGANKGANATSQKVDLGMTLVRPTTGTITCRYRASSHKGLDIANASGTPIVAAAGGKVTFSGYNNSYGNLVIITHANGVQTYYAHCSRLFVSVGQTVSQGQKIAAMGTTGNSTGNHLHLEIRVNGVAQNPQNYIY